MLVYQKNDINPKVIRAVKNRQPTLFIKYIKKESLALAYLWITTIINCIVKRELFFFSIFLALLETSIIFLCVVLQVKQDNSITLNNHLRAKGKKSKFIEKLITDETSIGLKIISTLVLSILFGIFYNPILLKETFLLLYGLIFFDVYFGDFHFTLSPKKLKDRIIKEAKQITSLPKVSSKFGELFFHVSLVIAILLHITDKIKNIFIFTKGLNI